MTRPPRDTGFAAAPHRSFLTALGLIVFLLLFLFPFDTGPDRFIWNPLFDAGHFGLFLVLAAALLLMLGNWLTRPYLTIGAGSILFAVVTELVQPFVGRSGSLPDLRNGVLGTLAGICIGALLRSKPRNTALLLIAAFLCAAVQIVLVVPAFQALGGKTWRQKSFPLLASFEHDAERYLWRANPRSKISYASTGATEGKASLKLEGSVLVGAEYSAGDLSWQSFQKLAFDVYSPVARKLKIRIDDAEDCRRYHQRFNRELELKPGNNSIEVPIAEIERGPAQRLLDVTRIRRVVLYTVRSQGAAEYYVDNMRLE